MYLPTTVQREPVIWFADKMESRLQANDHKGKLGWRECDMDYLQVKLLEELSEAMMAIRSREGHDDPVDELADAANILMMMADNINEMRRRRAELGALPPTKFA